MFLEFLELLCMFRVLNLHDGNRIGKDDQNTHTHTHACTEWVSKTT